MRLSVFSESEQFGNYMSAMGALFFPQYEFSYSSVATPRHLIVSRFLIVDKESYQKADNKIDSVLGNGEKVVFGDSLDQRELHIIRLNTQDGLLSVIKNIQKVVNESENPEYLAISKEALIHFNDVKNDLYIKLSDKKFVKVWSKESPGKISNEEWFNKKGTSLFIHLDDSVQFIEFLEQKLKREVLKIEEFNEQLLAIQEMARMIGINTHVIQSVDNMIKLVEKEFSTNITLSFVFSKIWDSSNYKSKLSILTSYFALSQIKLMNEFDQRVILPRIVKASLFMDLFLVDEDLIRLNSYEQIKNFPDETKNKILNHAQKAKTFLLDHSNFDLDILKLIEFHHELPQGEGFHKAMNENAFNPLLKLFISSLRIAIHSIDWFESDKSLSHKNYCESQLQKEGFFSEKMKPYLSHLFN